MTMADHEPARSAAVLRSRLAAVWPPLVVALGYYAGAKIGFALTLHPNPVSTLWPPNAILLAALVLTARQSWPPILLATFAVHVAAELSSGVPLMMVLCWFISNSAEAVLGAAGVRRPLDPRLAFTRFPDVVRFLAISGVLAPLLTSFLDAAFVHWNGWGAASFWEVFRVRFFSNVLAILVLVPVIVIVTTGGLKAWRRAAGARKLEAAGGAVALLAVSWVVFVMQDPGPQAPPALLYAPLPLLLAAAIRFGSRGASLSLALSAMVAIWGACRGQGPFVASTPLDNALAIQLFMIAAWILVMGLAAVLHERSRAEEQARHSQAQLALALEAGQLGTWDWHVQPDRCLKSKEARRMFGITDEVAMPLRRTLQVVHHEDRPQVSAAIATALAHRGSLEVEFRATHADGSFRWLLAKGKTIVGADGQPERMIGVLVDVTARKRAELEIQEQRRVLAHLGRVSLVGELSIALAHELNQPLAAILANARAARRFLGKNPPEIERLPEILDSIVYDDRRAADVITRVHALLRKEEVAPEAMDVNEVIDDVIRIVRADLITRGIALSTRLSRNLPPIAADRIQLQQVLLNLVLNASDAMRGMSQRARLLILASSLDDDGAVRVGVSDSGPGVPADQLERIFEPFVTSKPGGLGLGLAICRSIVGAHEGRLWAANNVAGGATFAFAIPAAQQPVAEVAAPRSIAAASTSARDSHRIRPRRRSAG
jgi:PAS domain S-box-containing protein